MTTLFDGINASTAFEKQLRALCLTEFPCGSGPWRLSNDKDVPESRFSITLKDMGAGTESGEALEELISSTFSPYSVDYSWSSEAKQLRDIAVRSPWVIDSQFILNHFKSLRIVDKNVNYVDENLLKFTQLEELTLSANKLSAVDTQHLPRTLKVLELVANQIGDLKSLCNKPPPTLTHLGLGLNKLSSIHTYITGTYWPSLLSLDLSHNDIGDLIGVVQTLATLPRLRSLLLVGNPLALIPGYRGFIIDGLRSLTILDDIGISADEKHHFKGLAKKKEYILDEARVTVRINVVTGVPMTPELQATEEQPEFPVITRTYYVEYMFLEDYLSRAAVSARTTDVPSVLTEHVEETDNDEIVPCNDEECTVLDKDADIESPPSVTNGTVHSHSPASSPKLISFRTEGFPWCEGELQFAWEHELMIDDLPALKAFFMQGMQLNVKEDKVLSMPAVELVEDKPCEASKKGGGASHVKSAKTGKDSRNEKGDKQKEKAGGGGGKKKKKEPEIELTHAPAEVTTLGSYTVDLSSFLQGEHSLLEICTCHGGSLDEVDGEREEDGEEEKKDESLDSKKDKKRKKETTESSLKMKKGKETKEKGKKSTKPDIKTDSKTKRPESQLSEADSLHAPPVPLNVYLQVELDRWLTARDSMPQPNKAKNKEKEGTIEGAATEGSN